ncbi:MAG: DUF1016 domain-containing protein [Alphaproteobacteria bacterium]|nr:DUF1016 domain-containing protein [Alphaproteobacteria bacterium]
MNPLASSDADQLYTRISDIIEAGRGHVIRSVNLAMVHTYWHIGREVVEHEQGGEARAQYGRQLVRDLSERLSDRYGAGFSPSNLWRMRQFYLTFPQGSPARSLARREAGTSDEQILAAAPRGLQRPWFPSTLGWTHYTLLLRVQDTTARAFYEIEAAREGWSTRELDRQIGSLLFERLSMSRDEEQVRALAREGQKLDVPGDLLKDPFVLEFLDLTEREAWQERDLEQAIIDRLEQMYVNWYDRFQREEWEQPTVGVVLCSEKNDAMVRITLPEDNQQILAARYQLYLPTEEELRAQLIAERERVELAARVAGAWEE